MDKHQNSKYVYIILQKINIKVDSLKNVIEKKEFKKIKKQF